MPSLLSSGEQVGQWYQAAQRLSVEAHGDRTARRYLCLAALLPSKRVRS